MRRQRNNDLTFTLIFWAVIIFAIAAGWLIAHYGRKKRAQALRRVAEELGLEYSAKGSEDFITDFGQFPLFSRGRAKKVSNLMRGAAGDRELAIFDYQFVTGSGKHSHTSRYTVLCIRFDGPAMPSFSLRAESVWDKIGSWFRTSDIDFDTHPKFSKRYHLSGDDETAIRTLFTSDVMEFYEGRAKLSSEALGQTLLIYRLGRIPPQEIGSFLGDGLELLSLFNRTT